MDAIQFNYWGSTVIPGNSIKTHTTFSAAAKPDPDGESPQARRMRQAIADAKAALDKKDAKERPKTGRGTRTGQGEKRGERGGWSGHADSVGEGRLAGYQTVGIAVLGLLALAGVGGILWKINDISQRATDNNAMPFNQPGLQAELDKMNGVTPSSTPAPSNTPAGKTGKGLPAKNQQTPPKKAPRRLSTVTRPNIGRRQRPLSRFRYA
jgi:hypothetical protein